MVEAHAQSGRIDWGPSTEYAIHPEMLKSTIATIVVNKKIPALIAFRLVFP